MRSVGPERKLLALTEGTERMTLRRLIQFLRSWVLSDSIVLAYSEWRNECAAVRDAYRRWACARALDERAAFDAYAAALDREERAATRYARLLRRAGRSGNAGVVLQLSRIQAGHGVS